jgi:hypothetical protein
MVALNPTLKRSASPRHAFPFVQPASLLRFALLFLMVATPVLLSLLPSQGEANYLLSVQMGEHSYGLPAYCESVTATLTQCTAIGTLPLSSEASSLVVKAMARPLQGSSEALECRGGLSTFSCGRSLTQLTNH